MRGRLRKRIQGRRIRIIHFYASNAVSQEQLIRQTRLTRSIPYLRAFFGKNLSHCAL